MRAEYVDHMGDDLRVVNAARVSFDKESEWNFTYSEPRGYEQRTTIIPVLKPGDVKLITYLATHGHWTPFSHPQITIRETVPIFVARQRFKHMIGFTYNEVSRRYVDSEPEFFVPVSWRKRAENKKQGSAEETIEGWRRAVALNRIETFTLGQILNASGLNLFQPVCVWIVVVGHIQRHVLIRASIRVVNDTADRRKVLHRDLFACDNLLKVFDVGDGCVERRKASVRIKPGRVEQVQELLRWHL
jgi:hypothetical protein